MCLIAYSPGGELIPRAVHDTARRDNADGIGVMSPLGVERFLGRKAGKRAWRYMRSLAEQGIPYGVHYRWATHGSVTLRNTHPFEGGPQGSRVHVMHNGIISLTAPDATPEASDTAIFVRDYMPHAPDPADEGPAFDAYWRQIEKLIGYGSKLLVMGASGTFRIVNEDEGTWEGGIWYSNEYSLPGLKWRRESVASYLCDDEESGLSCLVCWTGRAVRGEDMCAKCLGHAEAKPQEYECPACNSVYAEEDLWAGEPCLYCGVPRDAK